jgi:hypothetical protein
MRQTSWANLTAASALPVTLYGALSPYNTLRVLLGYCASSKQNFHCYTKAFCQPRHMDRKGCNLGYTVTGHVRIPFNNTPRTNSIWTPTQAKPTHTSRLPAFLWPFYLASLNRRFIRTGFGPVEPWPTSTCRGSTLASLSMLVATPCCPWTLLTTATHAH